MDNTEVVVGCAVRYILASPLAMTISSYKKLHGEDEQREDVGSLTTTSQDCFRRIHGLIGIRTTLETGAGQCGADLD